MKTTAIEYLIQQGYAVLGTGETLPPLYWATILGYEDIMIALLKAGADPLYRPKSAFDEMPSVLELAQQKKCCRFIAALQREEHKK